MNKRLLGLASGGLLALVVSSPASASLKLIVDNATVPAPTASDVTQFVDVYFKETAPLDNEQLNGMFLVAYLKGAGTGASGIHFGTFDSPSQLPGANHPFIFPGQSLQNFGSDATNYKVGADAPSTGNVNVTDNQGVVRLPIVIPAGTAPGTYTIQIDDGGPGEAGFTSFGTADEANHPDFVYPFTSQDGVLTVTAVPEPAALGFFAVAGVGCLLRRRRSA